jgi:hypothetical protein
VQEAFDDVECLALQIDIVDPEDAVTDTQATFETSSIFICPSDYKAAVVSLHLEAVTVSSLNNNQTASILALPATQPNASARVAFSTSRECRR